MKRNQKRRQSRLGKPLRPTNARRMTDGEPTLTPDEASALLDQRGVKVITTDRVKGGLRYNIVQRGKPRTLKVSA